MCIKAFDHSKTVAMVLVLLLVGACSSEPDQGELAAIAAKGYYDLLLEGNYGRYVDGTYRADSIPGSYRDQLVLNARMFMEQQQAEHRGIKEVRIATAKADTARHTARVLLTFVYGDSSAEEVLVPMVQVQGRWYMK